jgi:hypothetical protein
MCFDEKRRTVSKSARMPGVDLHPILTLCVANSYSCGNGCLEKSIAVLSLAKSYFGRYPPISSKSPSIETLELYASLRSRAMAAGVRC